MILDVLVYVPNSEILAIKKSGWPWSSDEQQGDMEIWTIDLPLDYDEATDKLTLRNGLQSKNVNLSKLSSMIFDAGLDNSFFDVDDDEDVIDLKKEKLLDKVRDKILGMN